MQTVLTAKEARARVASARRIVVKIGTNVIMRDDGALALGRVYGLIESVATLRKSGRDVLLVSSGAVGLGAQRLSLAKKPARLALKQACAAIGQSRLMAVYEEGFEKLGLVTAQILLTEDDFTNRTRYLNLSATLGKLLELGAVPILNENDPVSTQELEAPDETGRPRVFGDNDRLSALVMSKMDADLLVILSDVEGLYTANPAHDPLARLIPVVPAITPAIEAGAEGGGARGRGGMKTKLEAARIATASGGLAVIASGRMPNVLDRLFAGEEIGTVFLPGTGLDGKRRWIAFSSALSGRVVVNDGAKDALLKRKASLLPAGIVRLEGTFAAGEVVGIADASGSEFARGIVNYGHEDAAKLVGRPSGETAQLLAGKKRDALITRDNIVFQP
jgi:glutamate 5-kinase